MDARAPQANPQNNAPGFWRLIAFSTAAIPVAGLATPLSVYLPNYYASHLGLPLAAVGGVFFIVRLIDILFDPAIGVAVNATTTPLGRFRPWMIAGVPILVAAVYALFMAETGVGMGYLVGWLLILYVGFSVLTLGHSAWAAALVPEYHGRSRIYGMMQAVGVLGLVAILALPSFASTKAAGIHAMGWFVVFATPVVVLLCIAFVREPKRVESHSAVTLRDYWTMLVRPCCEFWPPTSS